MATPTPRVASLTALSAGLALSLLSPMAAAQVRVVSWNISFYGGGRASDIQTITYGTNPANGLSMRPDVIAAQEFTSSAALTDFRTILNAAPGSPGDWAAAPWIDGADTESVLVYRTTKLQLVGTKTIAVGSGVSTNQPRNTYRYDLRPVGYTAPAATFAIYNVHMKAGETSTDIARRLVESQRIRTNAEGTDTNGPATGLPAGYRFMVAGDMNTQTSSQSAYVEFIGSQVNNTGRFFDPIKTPGSWNNSSLYRFVHTQDPAGAGGMDDRHDQILVSSTLIDADGLDYVGNSSIAYSTSTWNDPNHSYRSYGNDGTSFNLTLKTTGNTMVGPTIAQDLIDVCVGAGHLPVYLDLRVPAEIATTTLAIDFGTVTQGATAPTFNLGVANAGNEALFGTVAGKSIDDLDYTLAVVSTPVGSFTAPAGSFTDAAGGAANSHFITFPTSVAGVKTGTLTINSNSPDEPARVITLTGTVVPPNAAPNSDAGPDQTVTDADGSGTEPVALDGTDSLDPDGTIGSYVWTEGATQIATGASPTVGLSVGVHTIVLTVTDDDLAIDTDTVVITVNPPANLPPTADAGLDQILTDSDNSGSETVILDGDASVDSDGTIANYRWEEGATILSDGPASNPAVSLPVGVHLITLTITDDDLATATDTVTITVEAGASGCGSTDFDGDGDAATDADIEAFFAVIGGLPCPTGTCASIDFDGDGDEGTDADIEAFFRVIGGGPCVL